jgi:hypothetical protein
MSKDNIDAEIKYFRVTTILIKIAIVMIGVTILIFSHFGFIFYSIAMLPSMIAIVIDKQYQASASSTVSTFNLIGILPYLTKLWSSPSIDLGAKMMSSDISTWVVIYGCALVGQTLYWIIPPVVAKLYVLKSRVEVSILTTAKEKLCAEWNIKYTIPEKKDSNQSN